ncbi:MAG: hypothetical protein ACRCRZ_00930 [Metamycoplasmataceae bacterium]
MSINKIFISHSENIKSLEILEELKRELKQVNKKFDFSGKNLEEKSINSNIFDSEITIAILTENLLTKDKLELINGKMFLELKNSLISNNNKNINGIILLMDEPFRKKYFNTLTKNNTKFPIIDKNIDNINYLKKSEKDNWDYMLIVKKEDFFKNSLFYIRKAEIIREKQINTRIYDINLI